MKLYSYFRSSAAYRVRIALNLKGIPYDIVPVHLLRDGGQQLSDGYTALNPSQLVPTLVDGDHAVAESVAIMEYLEETHPKPALLPKGAAARAHVRAMVQLIACDIHPLNNLRVLKYLKHDLQLDDAARDGWYRHWIALGLASLEAMLVRSALTGRFCCGDEPGMADACLVPQLFNARRMECDVSAFPTVLRIDAACAELDAFRKAAPSSQPDAEG